MKRIIFKIVWSGWILLAVVVLPGVATAGGKLKIITSTMDLKSIAEAVGGDRVKVDSIVAGRQDPHFIDAKPSYMVKLRSADLFIRIGLEMEIGWEKLLLQGSRNPNILLGKAGHLDASQGIVPVDLPGGAIDRSMGDVHTLGNPHYWLDPLNAINIAETISKRLIQLDPAGTSAYESGYKAFALRTDKALNDAGKGWLARMSPYKGARVMTFHRSWTYFLNRFGLVTEGELEPKPGIRPGPKHLMQTITNAKANNVKFILIEPFYDTSSADLVASKTGIKVLQLPNSVGGSKGIETYEDLIEHLISRIVATLEQGSIHD